MKISMHKINLTKGKVPLDFFTHGSFIYIKIHLVSSFITLANINSNVLSHFNFSEPILCCGPYMIIYVSKLEQV
jgi:hypothetical protein